VDNGGQFFIGGFDLIAQFPQSLKQGCLWALVHAGHTVQSVNAIPEAEHAVRKRRGRAGISDK